MSKDGFNEIFNEQEYLDTWGERDDEDEEDDESEFDEIEGSRDEEDLI